MTSLYSVKHLKSIFHIFAWYSKKLKSTNVSMKKSKCSFFSKEIQYLEHILSATDIWLLPAKTHTIQHMRPPTTPKQVRAFLGLVGYYRKFIKGFAKIAKPLTLLTRQQVKFDWTLEHHATFLLSKRSYSSSTHPALPKPQQEIHCVHRCFWWCLQSTALTRTQWNWVPSSIPLTYFHRNPMQKWSTTEQEAFGSILCHHQVELLLTRHWHHCQKWS